MRFRWMMKMGNPISSKNHQFKTTPVKFIFISLRVQNQIDKQLPISMKMSSNKQTTKCSSSHSRLIIMLTRDRDLQSKLKQMIHSHNQSLVVRTIPSRLEVRQMTMVKSTGQQLSKTLQLQDQETDKKLQEMDR